MGQNKIDFEALNDFINHDLDGELEVYERLLGLLVQFLNEFSELNIENTPQSLQSVKQQAHKIKSSCRSFGAVYLADRLQEIEGQAEASAHLEVTKIHQLIVQEKETTICEIQSFVSERLSKAA